MTRENNQGSCDKCRCTFGYYLINSGLNETFYAYCSQCGMTAVLDTGYEDRAVEGLPRHRSITPKGERYLAPCSCGGSFKAGAAPRCPHCAKELSATAAASWIESESQGSKQGWKWQNDWESLNAIVIEQRLKKNPWKSKPSQL
jgi:hypothetical protein